MPRNKKWAGKKCAYCGIAEWTTEDHVFARAFFSKSGNFRANLPKVPACSQCNSLKSNLENRIPVLLQFAGDTASSLSMFETGQIEKNLSENLKLWRLLKEGFEEMDVRTDGGVHYRTYIIKLGEEMINDISSWIKLIAKAIFFLWKDEPLSEVGSLVPLNPPSSEANEYFNSLIDNTPSKFSVGNTEQGWALEAAESEDGVKLFKVMFNSIVQYVAYFEDTNSSVARQFTRVGY